MNRTAILHRPMSEDAHGLDEKHVFFRLRAAHADLDRCVLYFGDRACRKNPVDFTRVEMPRAKSDTLFDYFEIAVESPYPRICYYFELWQGDERVYYYSDFFFDRLSDERQDYYQLPFNHRADLPAPPDWVADAIVYNIFPDSFATSKGVISKQPTEHQVNGLTVHGKLGGTLRGIAENLDYLADLGINCIYLNPIFVAGQYHKYDLIDYYHVDPCFGTDEDFRDLVKACHARGIRLLIDGVFNHVGWYFFAFDDVVKNGERSRYKDWFYALEFPVERPTTQDAYPTYACFAYERMMPKLATDNPEVIDYFCEIGRHWIETYDVDGWRLDVASEVDDHFWRAFRKACRDVKPDCFLIGEVWETARHWLMGDMFDSTMNYDFKKHALAFFAEEAIDAAAFNSRAVDMLIRYKQPMTYAQLNLLDSHDVPRFFSLCGEDLAKMCLAILFQMTFVGAPSIFYGDEKGLTGVLESEYRRPMDWGEDTSGLMPIYKALIDLRKREPALRRGDFTTLSAVPGSDLYAYARTYGEDTIVIALNNGHETLPLGDLAPQNDSLLSHHFAADSLGPKGFVVYKRKGQPCG